MLINNTNMSLRGTLVRQITTEILHHVKIFCIIYMGNLLVTIFFASLKAFKDSFCFTSSGISSHILGPRKAILSAPLYTELTRGHLKASNVA